MPRFLNTVNHEKVLCFFLIIAILATTAFIFSNSLKSRADSTIASSGVTNTLKPFVDPADKIPFDTLERYIRKYAHFLEFMLLGFELFAFLFLLGKNNLKNIKLTGCLSILLISVLIALCDETIQISSGRNSSVTDVWIDLSGALAGIVICFFAILFISFMKRKFSHRHKT